MPWGNEYHYDTIWMTVDAVDAKLWDPDLEVFINHENHCISHLYIYIYIYIKIMPMQLGLGRPLLILGAAVMIMLIVRSVFLVAYLFVFAMLFLETLSPL